MNENENEGSATWVSANSTLDKSNGEHFAIGDASKVLDEVAHHQTNLALAQTGLSDGDDNQMFGRLKKVEGQNLDKRSSLFTLSGRTSQMLQLNREKSLEAGLLTTDSIQDDRSQPTQVITDDPLEGLETELFATSIDVDILTMDHNEREKKFQNIIVGIDDGQFMKDVLLDLAEGMQMDLARMSQEQELLDGYFPVSFHLWFSVPRSYSEVMSTFLGEYPEPRPGYWLVNGWLMVLLASLKVQGLEYGTQLYVCLRKRHEMSRELLSTINLTSAARENWFIAADEPEGEYFDARGRQDLAFTHDFEANSGAKFSGTHFRKDLSGAYPVQILIRGSKAYTGTGEVASNSDMLRKENPQDHNGSSQRLQMQTNETKVKSYWCTYCGRGFRTQTDVDNHILEEHLPCDFCDRTFKDEIELTNHCDAKHQFVCYHVLCRRRSFRNQWELSNHLDVLHPNDGGTQLNPKFTEEPLSSNDPVKLRRQSAQSTHNSNQSRWSTGKLKASVPWH